MVISARAAAAALLTLAALALSACQGPAVAVSAHPRPSFSADPVGSEPPVGRGAGGAGSVTISVTKPVVISGHVDTTVSCTTANHTYTASADGTLIAGYHVAFTVRVAPYHGAGEYPAALVTLTLDGPTGKIGAASVPSPTTLTSPGGSFTLDTTTSNGQSFAAHLIWACSNGAAK
jgi:hypothetical protein